MALHEELNLMLRHGQRECLHLNGLIRKLKSGQAMLMMRRDKAKRELQLYVNKLSESLIEFRSEMYVSIQTEVEQKIKEITSLREKFEADILSYMELCDETEKMVRFGKSINNDTDTCKAEHLLKEFRQLQKLTSDIGEIDEIMKLEFYPALPDHTIASSMFGDLIRGGSPKFTKSFFSTLRARKSRLDNDQNTQTKPKSDKPEVVVEKMDQYTQTDTVREQHWNEPTNTTENQGRSLESTGYTLIPVDEQQYVPYPHTSPPGFEYVQVPYCTYETYSSHNPPPGFSVYQRTGAPQPLFPVAAVPTANLQVNSCMFTDLPVYHQGSQYNQPYTALAAPAVNYQVQSAPLHQCNQVISLERSTELTEMLESNYITDSIDVTQRTDESIEVESDEGNVENTEELSKDENKSKVVSKGPFQATPEHVNMEIDQMLSHIGHDLKEKLAKGEEVITPMRPLRRPLRLPKNYRGESKPKADSEVASCSCSRSSVDSGFIATDNSITETVRAIDNKMIKSEISGYVKAEQDENQDENEQIEPSEGMFCPDILDFSASSGIDLRDAVKGHVPSKREVRELNKETLQSPTKWLKGYLQQVLPGKDQKNATLKKCDENNNGLKECLVAKLEMKTEVLETDVGREVNNKDVTSTIAKDKVSVQSVENNVASKKVNATDHSANKLHTTDNDSKDTESQLKTISKCSRTEQTVRENSNQNKGSATDRKADTKNLKSAVKGFLGGQKEAKQRCAATYTRLGALQAHWLKHVPGTRIEAKYLFKCAHDLHFPIGVTTNSLQQIIVADTGNHCVKMFDQKGQFIRMFGGDGMRRPSAVVVNEFDHIFVKDDISIKVFDNLGDYLMDIATEFSKPFGLVLTPAKCLLVLETDRRHPALIHVSQDGNQVWRFPYAPLLKAPPGSKCRFMAVSENNVIVSDLGLSQIYITSFEGILFKVIGSPGNGIMQFFEPSGISVDNYGNIVIGDSRNNRIQVFRHDGSYTGLIDFDEKVIRPSGVHLTSDNKLIVVNFLSHAVKVYQLLA